ncbi:hypothetical protein HYS29_01350 [Candidatus Microgenomates bacterium]|nr:hypothetical protein [Candidatus Microgenomates bacterium]MBI2622282.1 hypothetical protein [Candidatus Microgenomates bacterium]
MERVQASLSLLLTPQEHRIFGDQGLWQNPKGDEWYIPEVVLFAPIKRGEVIKSANQARSERGFFKCRVGNLVGFPGAQLAISFQQLDKKTGQTFEDPIVLGVCNNSERGYSEIEGRNLTEELFNAFNAFGEEDEDYNLHLRERPTAREIERSKGPEM